MRIDIAAAHSFLRISRQIVPVTELTFGCQIFVSNLVRTPYLTFGGTNGYRCGTWMETRKEPPENGVSSGPRKNPRISVRSSLMTSTRYPSLAEVRSISANSFAILDRAICIFGHLRQTRLPLARRLLVKRCPSNDFHWI